MKARYNYRIYPKQCQLSLIAQAMGCARVVWNDALRLYKNAEKSGTDRPKKISNLCITQAKKTSDRAWLANVSSVVLQQSINDLQTAWKNYFDSKSGKRKGKEVGKPKWKKKQSRATIRFASNAFSVHSESVKLAKIGHIKMVVSRPLPSRPTSVTIIRDTIGRYFASFVVEIKPSVAPASNASCGIDLGLAHFAILSNGEKIDNPKWHKKMLKRIKRAARRLAKAKRGSVRRERRKKKLALLHSKIKQQRTDFHHKLTTKLVRENQALAVEDLNVSGMVKNRKLSRAISDAGWSSFKTMLEAKCDKYGRTITIVDRWYPSSQVCSCCGNRWSDSPAEGSRRTPVRGGKKELDVREWQCLYCLTTHDRDINASRNIEQYIREAGGQSDSYNNGRGASVSQPMVAVCGEASTTYEQLSLF